MTKAANAGFQGNTNLVVGAQHYDKSCPRTYERIYLSVSSCMVGNAQLTGLI
ncbi:MAG: hypothetical protein ACUBOA_15320 [Candidatus Loosdrechtia sp.]|uniref:hypothetical protein n=1 Tax=Candidatus Loosdrechtia sp. TaxID=3101272 RepID=UPI00403ADC8B